MVDEPIRLAGIAVERLEAVGSRWARNTSGSPSRTPDLPCFQNIPAFRRRRLRPIFRLICNIQKSLSKMTQDFTSIPIVDFEGFGDGTSEVSLLK